MFDLYYSEDWMRSNVVLTNYRGELRQEFVNIELMGLTVCCTIGYENISTLLMERRMD